MFPNTIRRGADAPRKHSLVLTAAIGASLLAMPLAAHAEVAMRTSMHGRASASTMKRETVEQRIAMLHTSLKITGPEEAQWAPVAQAMRENEASMQKLMAESNATPHPLNAVDDLRTYERFTQAHVNGLKNLISSFETLYQAMPDKQKGLADQVFRKFSARGAGRAS
jgi:hypothetical protein